MQLPARVRHEEVVAAVEAVVGRRDAHARVGVVDALLAGSLLESEAERRAGSCNVEVEPVRVEVVRDVEVEPAVVVDVGEDCPEAVVDTCRLEAGTPSHLAEPRAAVPIRARVQVEPVAHAGEVGGEAGGRARDRRVDVRVPGHEEIRAAVAVDVADCCARVPARVVDPSRAGAFGEGAVAVAPEKRVVPVGGDVVAGGRDEQVRVAVLVEVARDAAVSTQLQVGARAAADVHESTLDVVEERAPRQVTALRPLVVLVVRVGVDGVEVEPAVGVVVDPAEATAHHRVRLTRVLEVEDVLREVEPDLPGHVLQADAAERVRRRRRLLRSLFRGPSRRGDHVPAVLERELERAREVRRARRAARPSRPCLRT